MTKAVANVNISTDTFAGWLGKTNILLDSLTNEIVTVEDTTAGANSIGNGSVIGTFSANTLSANIIRGGGVGNTANVATLTLGISNSTVSSNIIVTGYTANIAANTLNISSNTNINATSLQVAVSTFTATGNTTIGSNSSHSTYLAGNTVSVNSEILTTTSNTYIQASNVYINAASVTIKGTNTEINATASFVGVALISTANVTLTNSNTEINSTNTEINGGTLHVTSNAEFVTTLTSTGNVYFNATNVAINSTNTTISGTQLNVTSNTNLSSANTTIGKTTIANTLTVQANTYVNTTIYFAQNKSAIVHNNSTVLFPNDGATSNIVATYAIADYKSGKLTINVTDNNNSNNKLITEISSVFGYNNINSTEYGTIFSNTKFMTFTLSSNSTHLIVSGVSNTTVVNTDVSVVAAMFS